MFGPGGSDSVATGQSRCGRVVFEYAFEHGFRPARHGEFACEDHDRRGGCVYVDSVDAWFTDFHRFAIGFGIRAHERAGSQSESDTGAASSTRKLASRTRWITGGACCITGRARCITGGNSVVLILDGIGSHSLHYW